MEDQSSLEQYLAGMAGSLTKKREQISYRKFFACVFHTMKELSCYNKDFQIIVTNVIENEREIQRYKFIAENHLQVNIHNDLWKLYERYGDALRLNSFDFSLIHCSSLRYELKYYLRYVYECTRNIGAKVFDKTIILLNALAEVNPRIKYFADITEADVKAMILFLENTYRRRDGNTLSQRTVAEVTNGGKRVVEYLMSGERDREIKAPQPYMNPFVNFKFHNARKYRIPTPVIPEAVIEQLNGYSDELKPLNKLLYDIFTNTGLRLKEVFFLETDCVEGSRYNGICQLKVTPYKVLTARRKRGVGDYHRVMIPQSIADNITCHIKNTAHLRNDNGSSYVFISQKPGYPNSIMDSNPFIEAMQNIIKKYSICDEGGQLWHLTSRQFRKTVAVTLIEKGATTAELAYWLGHLRISTTSEYYVEVRKMKLAKYNTEFFREKFDLIISKEQLEIYTEEERRLLYIDFRLEQRRVELGYCLFKAADGQCPNRNSLYNCVNCKNLCTGKKYLPYWDDLLTQQKDIVEMLIKTYHVNEIMDYADFVEYKQEIHLLRGYESIVDKIKEGDLLNE
jgi:integrase